MSHRNRETDPEQSARAGTDLEEMCDYVAPLSHQENDNQANDHKDELGQQQGQDE